MRLEGGQPQMQVRLNAAQQMIFRHLFAAKRHDQQHVPPASLTALRLPATDEPVRQLVGPLAIVEHQKHRPLGRGQRVEKAGEGMEGSQLTGGLGSERIAIVGAEDGGQSWQRGADRGAKWPNRSRTA